jgi:hypothetical protein
MKLLCFSGYILRGQAGRVSVRKRRHQRARARQNADSERGYTSPEKFTASVCAAWRGPGRAWTACLPALQWGVFTRTLQVHPRRCTSDRPTYIFQVSVPYISNPPTRRRRQVRHRVLLFDGDQCGLRGQQHRQRRVHSRPPRDRSQHLVKLWRTHSRFFLEIVVLVSRSAAALRAGPQRPCVCLGASATWSYGGPRARAPLRGV